MYVVGVAKNGMIKIKEVITKDGSVFTLHSWRSFGLGYLGWWILIIAIIVLFWLKSLVLPLILATGVLVLTGVMLFQSLVFEIKFKGKMVKFLGGNVKSTDIKKFAVEYMPDVDGIDDEPGTLVLYAVIKQEKQFLTLLSLGYDKIELEKRLNERLSLCL